MHQIAQIEFENCNFSASEGGSSPSEASERELPLKYPLFNGQSFIKVLAKASKQERWEKLET